MELPAWVRVGLFLGAVVAVLFMWDSGLRYVMSAISALGSGPEIPLVFTNGTLGKRWTEQERMLIEGDLSRATRHEQQRAIWEAHPESRVYLGNYITALAAGPGQQPDELEFYRRELAAAREIEPANARFDYLEAAALFDTAARIHHEESRTDDAEKKNERRLEVLDRKQVDEAMLILERGLAKPYWRRYAGDMLQEQLAVLGPPRRMIDLVQRTALAAGVLLPDLAKHRSLALSARLYAEQLIAEGETNRAIPFLDAWQTLTRHSTEDSFTLIGLLVTAAIANDAEVSTPPLYRRIGLEEEAAQTEAQAAALSKPVDDWRARRDQARGEAAANASEREKARQDEQALSERGGLLVSLLLPALGQWPEPEEYEPGRRLEYTVATEAAIGMLGLVFLVTMAVAFLIFLRWRYLGRDSSSGPLLLFPGAGAALKLVVLGVVLPWLVFLMVTRGLPWSGHAYSVKVGTHKLIAEFALLFLTMGLLPIVLAFKHVKRECQLRDIPVRGWWARSIKWPLLIGVVLLTAAWCLPPSTGEGAKTVAVVGAGMVGVALIVGMIFGVAQGLVGESRYGQFYGSSFRTLIPVLALVVIVMAIATRPFLLASEALYLQRDTLLYDPDRPGFTRIENDLVERLRGDMLRALAAIDEARSPEP